MRKVKMGISQRGMWVVPSSAGGLGASGITKPLKILRVLFPTLVLASCLSSWDVYGTRFATSPLRAKSWISRPYPLFPRRERSRRWYLCDRSCPPRFGHLRCESRLMSTVGACDGEAFRSLSGPEVTRERLWVLKGGEHEAQTMLWRCS